MKNESYVVIYKCPNCGSEYKRDISFGEYKYLKWCKKHRELSVIGAFLFDFPYWLYFRWKNI